MKTGAQRATGRPYVRSAEPDNSFWYLGQLMSALAEGENTGGRLTVYEILFPADSGPPLHVHEREDEAFYVLEGGLSVRMGDEEFEASPGSFVFQPRGVRQLACSICLKTRARLAAPYLRTSAVQP